MICNGDPVFFLAGMPGKELKVEKKINGGVIRTGETDIMMPFSYNISYGIAFGLMTYIAIKLLTGRSKKIGIGTWVIALLFIAMFFLTH